MCIGIHVVPEMKITRAGPLPRCLVFSLSSPYDSIVEEHKRKLLSFHRCLCYLSCAKEPLADNKKEEQRRNLEGFGRVNRDKSKGREVSRVNCAVESGRIGNGTTCRTRDVSLARRKDLAYPSTLRCIIHGVVIDARGG